MQSKRSVSLDLRALLLERDDRLDLVRRQPGNEVGQVRVGEELQWNDLAKGDAQLVAGGHPWRFMSSIVSAVSAIIA